MAKSEEKSSNKEGTNLLGAPTFTELDNGRFKCVETGHEVLVKDRESYSHSKRCRLGLIGFALSQNKPPLNMFKQDPLSRSKLICKLTGDTINKSEEHIWKHINGKRFLNKLEVKETEKLSSDGIVEEQGEQKPQKASKPSTDGLKKKKKKKKKKKNDKNEDKAKEVDDIISEVRNLSDEEEIDLEEADFWMPPVGERWDFDDGGDRWCSGSESGQESDEVNAMDGPAEEGGKETEELPKQTKRTSIEIGPSGFASRKKSKKHTN
ncbi:hypothetical protein F2P56_000502 [Juglans regia]|uniref:Uncharacterized protein LOC109009649 n=2 Tax=Juglans regia TaxID=51240 RepID=A0A2I4GPF0_JUGRE|nr:uncharacterized protein LOC109009649 [Juglans regia]KAF5479703.1 hypothetical protein F2P56_000502 [Juglans regia]